MVFRKCALQSPEFNRLLEVYTNRGTEAEKWRERGGKTVLKLGADVPDELIMAAGMMPVQIFANPEAGLEKTDTYLEFAFDPVVRHYFEKIVDGTCANEADFLAVSNSTDVVIRVFLYLREMKRINLENIPPITFLDFLFTRNRMHQERNELIVRQFIEQLEQWSGKTISDDDIRRAMEICNADREALRKISALRKAEKPVISGCEALVITGSALFMDRKEHARLVEELAQKAASWDELEGPRVYYTGSVQEDTTLYEMIESCGAVIVGEDHDWGDRLFNRDCNLSYPAVRGIVDRYMLREFSSKKAFVSQRVDTLLGECRESGAEAVIFYNNIYEEAASWDCPSQRKALNEIGVPSVEFVKMKYPAGLNEGLESGLSSFIAELKEGKNNA